MEIIRLTKKDLEITNYIIANFSDSPVNKEALPTAAYLKKFLTDDRTYLLAAMVDGLVVGYTVSYRFPYLFAREFLAYLYDIEVLPDHRKKGAGRLLIETLLMHLRSDGVTELWLGTAVDNIEAQRLFASTGAFKSGETFNDYTYHLK